MRNGSIEHPGYENRAVDKSKAGYQNIILRNGKYYMIMGTINDGEVDMSTPEAIKETIALRDLRRAKRLLPKAKY